METFTPSNAGPLGLSYSAPEDGDNNGGPPKVSDVRTMMEGIANDLAHVATGDATLPGDKTFPGDVKVGTLTIDPEAEEYGGIRDRIVRVAVVNAAVGPLAATMDEYRVGEVDGNRTLTLAHPVASQKGRRLRIVVETSEADSSLTIASPAGTIATMPQILDDIVTRFRWADLIAEELSAPTRYRWVLSACDHKTAANIGAEAWGAS